MMDLADQENPGVCSTWTRKYASYEAQTCVTLLGSGISSIETLVTLPVATTYKMGLLKAQKRKDPKPHLVPTNP